MKPLTKALLLILLTELLAISLDLAYVSFSERAEPSAVLSLLRSRPLLLVVKYTFLLLVILRLVELSKGSRQIPKWTLIISGFTLFLVVFPFGQFTAMDLGFFSKTQIALQVSPLSLVLDSNGFLAVVAAFWLFRLRKEAAA